MHEWSIADNLVKLVVKAVEREGLVSVSRVVIQVGVLRQVIPESLDMAFSFLAGETSVAGAALEIEMVPLKARCRDCGVEISEGEFVFICPACGGFDLDILSGKELYIDYIEGEKREKDEYPISNDINTNVQ
jgi:hydrogenase nickel incorporation protein HypA/HybF